MEKQETSFCLIHSFNMAFGERIISGGAVLSHIQQVENTLMSCNLQDFNNLRRHHTQNTGNFNIMILNHCLSNSHEIKT